MNGTPTPGSAGRLTLVMVLGAAAAFCLVMWGVGANSPSTAGATHEPTRPSAAGAPTPAPASRAPSRSQPVRPVGLSIPSIGVHADVTGLGQHRDGTVEVPANPDEVGWYRLGPPPGAPGSSVILGHVDSMSGPAVFYRLKELRPGDRIAVRLSDATTAQFVVHSIRTYANADFPATKVYGKQGRSMLNLITCGGGYDSTRGGYQANVVVTAWLRRPVAR